MCHPLGRLRTKRRVTFRTLRRGRQRHRQSQRTAVAVPATTTGVCSSWDPVYGVCVCVCVLFVLEICKVFEAAAQAHERTKRHWDPPDCAGDGKRKNTLKVLKHAESTLNRRKTCRNAPECARAPAGQYGEARSGRPTPLARRARRNFKNIHTEDTHDLPRPAREERDKKRRKYQKKKKG